MTITVLQLSDIHLASEPGGPVNGCDPDARLAAVLAAWAEVDARADIVVLTGDNADDGSTAAYGRLAACLSVLDAPVLAVAGNHDNPAKLAAVFGSATHVEVAGWRLVGVASYLAGEIHGRVDVPAVLALLDDLDDRPTVAVIHHPPVSQSAHPWFRLDGGATLLAGLAERPHVRALVSGHLHDPFDFEGPGGLPLLGCPSTLVPIAHHGDRFDVGAGGPTGARVLHLEDDGSLSSTLLVA